ncbi:aminofutalosine synthase MqnE [Streptomyces odontomachi]|uniref:aminofutalosine synthase MqnE n=1 Tax=Streptomyces odontomachi TaxID=2944940 RepID=UPI00210BCB65|nr:aminofutalosine synthase MqnE [Streptomyces sp. ODS25]
MDAGRKRALEEKVRGGERLSREDGLALYASDDLAWLGGLAHEVRTRRSGDTASFTLGTRLSLTDVCTAPCAYCSTAGEAGGSQDQPGEADAYAPHIEAAVRRARESAAGLTELRIEAGPHPTLPWGCYPRALKALKEALPQLTLTAFTATDIQGFERLSGLPASDVLDALVDAGLASLAPEAGGQGADDAVGWADFARIHRLAHAKGLKTPCTMRYGHTEEPRHRVDHVLRLRALQDETGGFQVFVPLRHRPDATEAGDAAPSGASGVRTGPVSGAEALKTFAISRLLFDNVPHVGVSWATYGERTVLLALQHGADDIDGPVLAEPEPEPEPQPQSTGQHPDGSGTPAPPTRDDLLDLVRDAGLRPVARDTRHEVVRAYEGADPGRRDVPQPMRV